MHVATMPLDSKCSEASFWPNSTDLLCLRVAKVPRCQDLVIFFDDNDINNNDNRTLSLAHVQGVNIHVQRLFICLDLAPKYSCTCTLFSVLPRPF